MAVIDRVKFDGLANREWLVYKHPSENLVYGTQLIVGEGQTAVFVSSGKIADVFGAGSHTLSAQNMPLLQGILNLPFGGKTPFPAEIFYFNNVSKLDITWGTSDPILLIDPKYSVRLHIRAFGQMGLKLNDCAVFLRELMGVMQMSQFVKFEKLQQYFKGVIVQKIKVIISDIIINQGISALEITPHIDEISQYTLDKISAEFSNYGLLVANFYIQSINFPDEDFDAINAVLEKRAEFDLMGDARYAASRTFDVYEGAAINQNGVAGAFMAGGVGLGAGITMGQQMPQVMADVSLNGKICPKCHTNNPQGTKYCSNCAESLQAEVKIEKACPYCENKFNDGVSFCPFCGKSLLPSKCSDCSSEIQPNTKFCPKCGKEAAL